MEFSNEFTLPLFRIVKSIIAKRKLGIPPIFQDCYRYYCKEEIRNTPFVRIFKGIIGKWKLGYPHPTHPHPL
jgi:hypothetical protein